MADTTQTDYLELRGRFLLVGPPGTGKTTFLADRVGKIVEATEGYIPPGETPVLISSLTRTAAAVIAERVSGKLPKGAVATLHAHGLRSQEKPRVLGNKLVGEFNQKHPEYGLSTDYAADDDGEGLQAPGGDMPGDVYAEAYHLMRHRMIPRDEWPSDVSGFADAYEAFKRDAGVVDYTDMIAMAADFPPISARVMIVDESQDLSALEWELVHKWEKCCRALIAVGDPYQAIYHWRGAKPNHLIDQSIPADHRGVLKQSYRVPAAVHAEAMRWAGKLSDFVPIEYYPRKDENGATVNGSVEFSPDALCRNADDIADRSAEMSDAGKTVMIAATCGYMLKSVLAALRVKGVPFHNPYRTHSGEWNPLARRKDATTTADRLWSFLMYDRGTRFDERAIWTMGDLHAWVEPLIANGTLVRGAKADIARAAEIAPDHPCTMDDLAAWFEPGSLDKLLAWFDARNRGEDASLDEGINWWLERISPTKNAAARYAVAVASRSGPWALLETPRVCVGTIHSFKGGEADHVFLSPDLSRAGGIAWRGDGDHEEVSHGETPADRRNSVIRTFYVGMTRAKESLTLLSPSFADNVSWRDQQ